MGFGKGDRLQPPDSCNATGRLRHWPVEERDGHQAGRTARADHPRQEGAGERAPVQAPPQNADSHALPDPDTGRPAQNGLTPGNSLPDRQASPRTHRRAFRCLRGSPFPITEKPDVDMSESYGGLIRKSLRQWHQRHVKFSPGKQPPARGGRTDVGLPHTQWWAGDGCGNCPTVRDRSTSSSTRGGPTIGGIHDRDVANSAIY